MSDVPFPNNAGGSTQSRFDTDKGHTDEVMEMHQSVMREMRDPNDGISPTPVSFLLACFFFVGWGGWYISEYNGGWVEKGYNELLKAGGAAQVSAPVDPMVLGREVYGTCIQCHQGDAKGLPDTYPPLAGSEFVNGDPRRLTSILLHGLEGPVTVSGKPYNGKMPAWKDQFNDQELAALLTYVRKSFGNSSPPIDEKSVAAMRKELEARTTPWKIEELNSLPAAPTAAPAAPAAAPAAPPAATK